MAALTKTVTNSLALFGPAPSDTWNAYAWNAFKWGEGTAGLAKTTLKAIPNSLTLIDAFTHATARTISNSLASVTSIPYVYLFDRAGYSRLFPGGVTNSESRVNSSWTPETASTTTWSSGTASSTTWSQS